MDKATLSRINAIFSRHPEVKLVYLFGSAAEEELGPLSDYDFAVYFDPYEKVEGFRLSLTLGSELSKQLSTDAIDLLILNSPAGTELKYEIIANGRLIYEVEPYRILVEPIILNEYFDFRSMLVRHKLTQVS
ncbi:MAG: type VII toxin-antitoxin system MntA family adenylyltransferase antitoxin [Anaerolineales bacterium]